MPTHRWILATCVLLTFSSSGWAQESNSVDSLTAAIDSLTAIKQKLESELAQIQQQIDKAVSIQERKRVENELQQGGIGVILERYAKFTDKPFGTTIKTVSPGDTVLVLKYDFPYFCVIVDNKIGYIPVGLLPNDDRLDTLKEIKKEAYEKAKAEQQLREEQEEKKTQTARKQREAARKQHLIEIYGKEKAELILQRKVWIGMTSEMARESWGKPEKINKTITASIIHEQWVYSLHSYLYFENGILVTIQN